MIRLGLLILATLAVLVMILSVWGSGDPRADRRPLPDTRGAATDPGAEPGPALPQAQAQAQAQLIPAVIAVETQTPRQVQRFPGPVLKPSPEHAGRTAAPAAPAEGAAVLYVTGDRVNMRAGPSTGARVVAGLTRGTAVRLLGPADADWLHVSDARGRPGYVAAQFLSGTAP